MNDPTKDAVTWNGLTWQDIQSIGMALAEGYPDEKILTLTPQRLTGLVVGLPGFVFSPTAPDDFTFSAIVTAWIAAEEGDDTPLPYHPPA